MSQAVDSRQERIAVVGAGSWGTALAYILGRAGRAVSLWARDAALADHMAGRRVNARYLPEATLPAEVTPTADLAEAVRNAATILVVVPSVGIPQVAEQLAGLVAPDAVVISAAKGLDHETGQRLTEALASRLPSTVQVGALSGPNLSHEIVAGAPSASVVALAEVTTAQRVQRQLSTTQFRVYTNTDIAGVELGGALKNPLAIAAGITDGLGYGDNSKAALMTRGMHEIRRLGMAMGADGRTFSGLCGFGDLLATCHSRHSRNRNLGEQLGRGRNLAEVLAESSQVAEGVPTSRTAVRLAARYQVDLPILTQVACVLYEGKPVEAAVRDLLSRDITEEFAP